MHSADYIPFVHSSSDAHVARKYYADAPCFRVSLCAAKKLRAALPPTAPLWIDPSFDGYPEYNDESDWAQYYSTYKEHAQFTDPDFLAKPDVATVRSYVSQVMDAALAFGPKWISVPQLAHADDTSHNRINKLLADAFRIWRTKSGFSGTVILPAVFTNQRQVNNKVPRDKKLKAVFTAYSASGASGVWAVDSSLADQLGTANLDTERFPALIWLHTELKKLPNLTIHVAGPYWGLNLVLWARGLITHPAVALGTGYRYFLAGQFAREPTKRVALAPLRRWAQDTADFRHWLSNVIAGLSPAVPAHKELLTLQKELPKLSVSANGHKEQVARFYKEWLGQFTNLPPAGRSIALYQDLSNAYVFGQTLPELPSESGGARKPSTIARQLMLCSI